MPLYATEVKHIKSGTKRKPVCRKISSPKVLQQFSTVGRIIRKSANRDSGRASGESANGNNVVRTPGNQTRSYTGTLDTFSNYQQKADAITSKQLKEQNEGPVMKKSHFFREANQKVTNWVIEDCKEEESIMFCGCGKECKESFSMCEECLASGKIQEAEGYLYLKRDKNNLDRYWFKLINQELYSNVNNNHRV